MGIGHASPTPVLAPDLMPTPRHCKFSPIEATSMDQTQNPNFLPFPLNKVPYCTYLETSAYFMRLYSALAVGWTYSDLFAKLSDLVLRMVYAL